MTDRTRNWDKTPAAAEYRSKFRREHYATISIDVTPETKEALDRAAKKAGMSRAKLITQLITDYLASDEQPR